MGENSLTFLIVGIIYLGFLVAWGVFLKKSKGLTKDTRVKIGEKEIEFLDPVGADILFFMSYEAIEKVFSKSKKNGFQIVKKSDYLHATPAFYTIQFWGGFLIWCSILIGVISVCRLTMQ